MKGGSLRFRLLAAAAVSILMALSLASMGLITLFERHVERRFASELEADLRQIVGSLGASADGTLAPQISLAEPRFSQPLSGLYWQVMESGRTIARSRSLWDTELALPADDLPDGDVHQHAIKGPSGATLFAVERAVALPTSMGGQSIRAVVAVDHAEITAARNAFATDLVPYVGLLAAFLLAAAWAQVMIGLRPLNQVRARLAEVRAGHRRNLGSVFPEEVRPLASEVDLLLEAQRAAIDKARSSAADLAHGLRTPLTVLQSDAEELKARGETALGEEIAELTQSMRRHVDRELARARVGSRGAAKRPEPLLAAVHAVVRVVSRLPAAAETAIEIDVPHDLAVPMDSQDLAEILGNLADNAVKWARSRIRVEARKTDTEVLVSVEDDGPGIPDAASAEALARGGRLDERRSGTGLGLAIVQDILEAYDGTLRLGRSKLGGLRVEVRLPTS